MASNDDIDLNTKLTAPENSEANIQLEIQSDDTSKAKENNEYTFRTTNDNPTTSAETIKQQEDSQSLLASNIENSEANIQLETQNDDTSKAKENNESTFRTTNDNPTTSVESIKQQEDSQSLLASSIANTIDTILNDTFNPTTSKVAKKRSIPNENNEIDIKRRKNQRKCYFDLSEIQKARNRRELRVHYKNLASCAESMGLAIDHISFIKNEGKPRNYVNCLTPKVFQEKKFSQQIEMAFKTLKAKDICNLSYKKFTLFKNSLGLEHVIPANGKCDKIKEKLNKFFEIEETSDGVYLKDPIKKIELVCKEYYKQNNRKIENGKIMLKVACDGTNLTTKNMKQLNITFTLINDKKNAMSAKGNFILGMYKMEKECYDTMKAPMKKVFEKLEQIKSIKVGPKVYPVEHFSGGDMKSLALLYGINSANSNQPCVWCQWVRTSKFDANQTWPKRSLADAKANIGRNGYINEPLTYVDFDHCPVDMLHLLIRISERLCDLLENKLIAYDGYAGEKIEKRVEFKKWVNFWQKDVVMTNAFMTNKENILIRRGLTGGEFVKFFEKLYPSKYENESNDEYMIRRNQTAVNFFKEKFVRLHRDDEENRILLDNFDRLFSGFYELFSSVRHFRSHIKSLNRIRTELKDWATLYDEMINPKVFTHDKIRSLINLKDKNENKYNNIISILTPEQIEMLKSIKKDGSQLDKLWLDLKKEQIEYLNDSLSPYVPITPYIHVFVHHVPDFLEIYDNLNIFNTQGLEKLNDLTTIDFHSSTNKNLKNNQYLKQLMEKRNRIEFYHLNLNLSHLDCSDLKHD